MGYKNLQLRRDTAANWTSNNPTLLSGEPGFESDTGKLKIGDGVTAWTALGYITDAGGADVKVAVDAAANADYIGAASNDGVLRTSTGLTYTDGGDFVTLAVDIGIADDKIVQMDDADAADDDYAKFTANGLEGRSSAEVISDLGLGQWTAVAYNSANFTSDIGSWTVEAGDQTTYSYMIIGNTMYLQWRIVNTSVSGTPNQLRIAIPVSKTSTNAIESVGNANNNAAGNKPAIIAIPASGTYVILYPDFTPSAWSNATNATNVFGCIAFQIN